MHDSVYSTLIGSKALEKFAPDWCGSSYLSERVLVAHTEKKHAHNWNPQ